MIFILPIYACSNSMGGTWQLGSSGIPSSLCFRRMPRWAFPLICVTFRALLSGRAPVFFSAFAAVTLVCFLRALVDGADPRAATSLRKRLTCRFKSFADAFGLCHCELLIANDRRG